MGVVPGSRTEYCLLAGLGQSIQKKARLGGTCRSLRGRRDDDIWLGHVVEHGSEIGARESPRQLSSARREALGTTLTQPSPRTVDGGKQRMVLARKLMCMC